MLSAAATKLCLLEGVPDPYYTEELHNFFRAINEDYPGHKEWFKRERTADGAMMLSTLLNEMDGIAPLAQVVVIGATNRPDILDPAVTRPGRLDQLIHIPLPDRDSRLSVFQASLRKAPLDPKVNLEKLADFTEGFSGADISEICQRAAKNAVKDAVRREQAGEAQLPFVSKEHFEEAVSRARKSIPQSEIDRYNSFDESMKTSAKSTATQVFSFAQKGWVSAADASTPDARGTGFRSRAVTTPRRGLNR